MISIEKFKTALFDINNQMDNYSIPWVNFLILPPNNSHNTPEPANIITNIHMNDWTPAIGIAPNSFVVSLNVCGIAAANSPAIISETAVAENITPIVNEVYFTGANFEMKLKEIGIINSSPITINIENSTNQTMLILLTGS